MHISIRKKYGDMQIFIHPVEDCSYGGRHHIDFLAVLVVLDVWIRDITFPL